MADIVYALAPRRGAATVGDAIPRVFDPVTSENRQDRLASNLTLSAIRALAFGSSARLIEGDSERLERSLAKMPIVVPGDLANMDAHPRIKGDGGKEFSDVLGAHPANALPLKRHIPPQIPASADIDCDQHQRVIHWKLDAAKAANSWGINERKVDSLADHDARVFDRVMIVNREIAIYGYAEIKHAVKGHLS